MLMEVSKAYLEGAHVETPEGQDPERPVPRLAAGTIDAAGPRTPQVGRGVPSPRTSGFPFWVFKDRVLVDLDASIHVIPSFGCSSYGFDCVSPESIRWNDPSLFTSESGSLNANLVQNPR